MLILELQEMIKVAHEVACRIGFSLICNRGQQERVLKPTKNDHFQLFLVVWVLFLRILGRLKSGIYWNCIK